MREWTPSNSFDNDVLTVNLDFSANGANPAYRRRRTHWLARPYAWVWSEVTYHHGELRSVLVKSATQLIRATETSGATDWSMRKLAREAGVSQAAPYRHFESKEALEEAVADNAFVEVERRYLEALKRAEVCDGICPASQIEHALGLAYLQYSFDEPALFRMVFTSNRFLRSRAAISSYMVFRGAIGAGRCDVIWASVHGVAHLILNGVYSQTYGEAMAKDVLNALTKFEDATVADEEN